MLQIATDLQKKLKETAPVETGKLRDSIKVIPFDQGRGLIILMADYGKYVEFGSNPKQGSRIRPNPFIRSTIRMELPKIIIKDLSKEQ